jgi:hypothetical protein
MRSETKFRNEAQWNFLGRFFKQDPCQNMTGLGKEKEGEGSNQGGVWACRKSTIFQNNCASKQSCQFQNPLSITTHPPLPASFPRLRTPAIHRTDHSTLLSGHPHLLNIIMYHYVHSETIE